MFSVKKSKVRTDSVCQLYVKCTPNGQRFKVVSGFTLRPEDWAEIRKAAFWQQFGFYS